MTLHIIKLNDLCYEKMRIGNQKIKNTQIYMKI